MVNRKRFPEEVFVPEGVVCGSVEETRQLGQKFADLMVRGDIISLEGPLGAGKTQFVKGLALGMHISEEVSSPTFTLVHEYAGGKLIHFDFYRLEREEELRNLGFEDYLGQGILAIEWGDKFPHLFAAGTIRLRFELITGGGRRILGSLVS